MKRLFVVAGVLSCGLFLGACIPVDGVISKSEREITNEIELGVISSKKHRIYRFYDSEKDVYCWVSHYAAGTGVGSGISCIPASHVD